MKFVAEKHELPVGNRDGAAFAVKDSEGNCWLVLEADTYHNPEFFSGMGSTEQMPIGLVAFETLKVAIPQ